MRKPKEVLMWSNDAFFTTYIVTAETQLEAAQILARYRGETLGTIKKIYTPMDLDDIIRLDSGSRLQTPNSALEKEAA